MVNKKKVKKQKKNIPIFLIVLFNFLVILLLLIYIIYLRFIPYLTVEYSGYAVSGKELINNLLNVDFDASKSIKALRVQDQDEIFGNVNGFYLGASKKDNINLNYPIYVNNSLAICNLSQKVKLITDDFHEVQGYKGMTLTSGELYNTSTLQRADYNDYILLKNQDSMYINTKAIKIKTQLNEYEIKMNSINNFTSKFITYYSLKNDEFVYEKILDVDDNSKVIIEDYGKEYTYKEFLLGLNIIKEEIQIEEKQKDKEDKKDEKEEIEEPEIIIEEPEEIIEQTGEVESTPIESKWIKPTVTCENFIANVYSATTKLSISDPSKVINKAVTFTFYQDDAIAFRTSATSSGILSVIKLLPDTKYKIVGTFQYRNREGSLLENTILEQEIKTNGVDTLNTIDLEFQNGQIYPNKIEIADLHIASDIGDEAIYGVSKAEVVINGTKYSLESSSLRKILKGEKITYQSKEGLGSSKQCEYEIKFYDTAGNTMKLKNNKGKTVTSKAVPTATINVSEQDIISVSIEPVLTNEDNVYLDNFRYVIYAQTGEVVSRGNISSSQKIITLNNLDPQITYTIRLYADYDIDDGRGVLKDQEIGVSTFTTLPISKLGSLKLTLDYDDDTDLTANSINLKTAINVNKTDIRLLQILKSVTLEIKEQSGNVVKQIEMTDINALSSEDGISNLIENLNSKTTYSIVITAKAMQGNTQADVATSYTLNKFLTHKMPAKLNIKNVIVTTNLIDMDIYIEDIDNSCIGDFTIARMFDEFEKDYIPNIEPSTIESNTKIPTNTWVRLTYTGLNEGYTYDFSIEASAYNETNDAKKVLNNVVIEKTSFTTQGLAGTIDLLGLERQKRIDSENLIDITSQTNWYSKCFDVMDQQYELSNSYDATYNINAKYNYEKTYEITDTESKLKLLSNQCYVYDFTQYIGQTVTISFLSKTTNANGQIYIQKGKEIGQDIEKIEGIKTNAFTQYEKTLTIPEDGYLGFYLENLQNQGKDVDYYLEVKNLKVELGDEATTYSPYQYDLQARIKATFLDENNVTYLPEEQSCKYYIRMTTSNDQIIEYDYQYDSNEQVENIYEYLIQETNQGIEYKFEIVIKQNEREYSLDQVVFKYDPENCKEIKSITNEEEYKDIQPYGNYIILNNLNFRNSKTKNEFTYGNPKIPFYGSIDYNGKTIYKDTYSQEGDLEATSYLIYKIDESATIKNIVVDYYINTNKNRYTTRVEGTDQFIAQEDGIYSIFLYNEGLIDNVFVNLRECTRRQRINVGLVGYKNSGTLQNFIVNYGTTLFGSKYISGVCLYSDGIIQNGYLYGKGIEAIDQITENDYRYVAGVVFQVEGAGILQNVFNLSMVMINHFDSTYSYGANIVYNVGYAPTVDEITGNIIAAKESTAIARNVYSVQPLISAYNDHEYYGVLDATNKEGEIGPNILYKYTSTQAYDSYYFCDATYEPSQYNVKTSGTALYEPGVQDVMLNSNGFNQFVIDLYVNNGYYPQLKLNYCMPKQENLRIDSSGNEMIDILSSQKVDGFNLESIEVGENIKDDISKYIEENNIDLNDENIALAQFRVYNPGGTTITQINMNYLSATILGQSYKKKVSTVVVLLDNPTSYLDEYTVESIQSKMANGRTRETKYGENEDAGIRAIEVSFTKDIYDAYTWYQINEFDENGVSGLIQNYRLIEDIDFDSADYGAYITGTFEGNLDGLYNGKVHTIKNIVGTQSVIKGFAKGKIQNLNIENLIINTSSDRAGFIERAEVIDNIILDNIHIKDMEINSTFTGANAYHGGICAIVSSGSTSLADTLTLQNSSVQDLTISYENKSVTNIRDGGLIGSYYLYGGVEGNINNCYVQNLLIDADVTSNTGVGGIIGVTDYDTNSHVKPGTPYINVRNCYAVGKINTKTHVGGIVGLSYTNTIIQKCLSQVNINSKLTVGTGYIGGISGYGAINKDNISHNIYLGNIYVAGNNVSYVNRIVGLNTSSASQNNYAYKDQLINGEVLKTQLGATKLLTYEEIFQMNTYDNLLEFKDNYAYEIVLEDGTQFNLIEKEYLPQLNDTNGKLIPNQKYNALDNELKLDSIQSVPSEDKTKVTVTMTLENPKDLELVDVKIENQDMEVIPGTWETYKNANGLTVVTFVATPNRAYDSYKIESIYYDRMGQRIEKEISTKIKVELFKGISNAREWNQFFQGDGRTYPGQNIKILGDIDFSTVDKIESSVVIGKLEADTQQTFSNINISQLTTSKGFINETKATLKNLRFENCEINGKGSYVGLIGICRGEISDVSFSNILINCPGYDYIGIISRCIAVTINNVTIDNVVCKGRNYVGGFCGYATLTGISNDVHGTYINITATGDYSGGLFGYTNGNINNLSAYQYSEDGKKEDDDETSYLVQGRQVVGGCVGYYAGGGSKAKEIRTRNSILKGTNFVGANCGQVSGNTEKVYSENNIVTGTGNYVGGNVGYYINYTGTELTSINNEVTGNNATGGNIGGTSNLTYTILESYNNNIKGTLYVGGCVGYAGSYSSLGYILKSYGNSQIIRGTSYVGGVVGRQMGRLRQAEAIDCDILGTGNYVGGISGSEEYTTTSISTTNNANYSIAGVHATNLNIRSRMNYAGGVTGSALGTVYAGVVDNCDIVAEGNYAGGIAGAYTGYQGTNASSIASSSFSLTHSHCVDSSVQATNIAGGIVGNFTYGNVQYCYLGNTEVLVAEDIAGGLIGNFDNSKLSNIQYKATIKYNYVANTIDGKKVEGGNYVGGLIGNIAKELNYIEDVEKYNNIECNLVATDVESFGNYIGMGIASVNQEYDGTTQRKYMNNIYVYNCSKLNDVQSGSIEEQRTAYHMVKADELSLSDFYTKNDKVLDENNIVIGNEGLNFGTLRFEYNDGFFPILRKAYQADNYWAEDKLNIVQNLIAIPTRVQDYEDPVEPEEPEEEEEETQDEESNLEEILGTTSTMSSVYSLRNTNYDLPKIYVYPSDIDKINIEFSEVNENTKISIATENGIIMPKQELKEQVYTVTYDFKTPLEIVLSNSYNCQTQTVKASEVQNQLTIVQDEYVYLQDNKIYSSKRQIEGEFVNIYKGKMLDIDGNIINIQTMEKEENVSAIEKLEKAIALMESEYSNMKIQTFAHCSKVIESEEIYTYKRQQIISKNGALYALDNDLESVPGAIIIDSYNSNQYETILGLDGKLYDLMTKLNYPEDFKNENIKAMTNNLTQDTNDIVLIYYSSGRVYGFNYITGDVVFDNNIQDENIGLIEYISNNLSSDNIKYDINTTSYQEAQELAGMLEEVSVDEAIEQLKIETTNENSTANAEDNSYITTYDAISQSYVVYSAQELLNTDNEQLQTKNEKISTNSQLISYYSNRSKSTKTLKDIGIIIIASIVGTICIILIVFYRKNNK